MTRDGLIATLGPIRQIAWLTEDLDAATGRWRTFAGIGPWTVYRNVTLEGRYRGRSARVTIDVALSYQDGTQIEIIRPHGRGPSPYHDEGGRVRVGMHHVAWLVQNVAAAKETATKGGLDLLFEAEAGGGATRVAYLQAPDDPAMLLELIAATPATLEGFHTGAEASRYWDGVSAGQELDLSG
ncbi:VOC family protein [Sphingomonas sp. CL5.1]|uniref:VOC family protein n=1 Tax=Sphingomonas sp. CL5.1 TaxID=2653203 RepID=UPI001581961B|nr:VOC family protein [Sphingomonas sp. CL5.1]QKS01411.1 VOC family protein [Sphingomonas sp. CL5.1]